MGTLQSQTWRKWRRFRRTCWLIVMVAGVGIAALGAAKCEHHQTAPTTTAVDARTCAARAVYAVSDDDWGLRATVAKTTLNVFSTLGPGAPCRPSSPLPWSEGSFDTARWQAALDVVDAVASGDYVVSPLACARATVVLPSAAAPRAQCVYGDLAFLGGDA